MIRRYCSVCKKRFIPQGNEWQCVSCRRFNEYRTTHRQTIRINEKDEIHFYFDSWTVDKSEELLGFRVFGNCQYDKKDATHVSVNIYLHKIEQSLDIKTDDERIKLVVQVLNHETLHKAIYLATSDFQTSKSADKSLMKDLEQGGYI